MIDIILLVISIISIIAVIKPDIMLSKVAKERANGEQRRILENNYRKIYGISSVTFISILITQYFKIIGIVLLIPLIVLEILIVLPASKQNSGILKELN